VENINTEREERERGERERRERDRGEREKVREIIRKRYRQTLM
jgi:hypothetical protein